VLDSFPEATVAGSKVALAYLQSLTHRPFTQQPVKGGDKIDLGSGHVLEFVMAPNLHWPDTMFSFDHATGPAPHLLGLAHAHAAVFSSKKRCSHAAALCGIVSGPAASSQVLWRAGHCNPCWGPRPCIEIRMNVAAV
jgi:hypothetical protein